jgi:hypothetical protein
VEVFTGLGNLLKTTYLLDPEHDLVQDEEGGHSSYTSAIYHLISLDSTHEALRSWNSPSDKRLIASSLLADIDATYRKLDQGSDPVPAESRNAVTARIEAKENISRR